MPLRTGQADPPDISQPGCPYVSTSMLKGRLRRGRGPASIKVASVIAQIPFGVFIHGFVSDPKCVTVFFLERLPQLQLKTRHG